MFVFKIRHGLAPPFLSDTIIEYAPTRSLRSADQLLLTEIKTKKRSRGDRAFAAAAPKLWNALPLFIRSSPSIAAFKTSLKTHFYSLPSSFILNCVFFGQVCFVLLLFFNCVLTVFLLCFTSVFWWPLFQMREMPCSALWLTTVIFKCAIQIKFELGWIEEGRPLGRPPALESLPCFIIIERCQPLLWVTLCVCSGDIIGSMRFSLIWHHDDVMCDDYEPNGTGHFTLGVILFMFLINGTIIYN